MSFLALNGKQKTFALHSITLHYYMWQNIGMPYYYGTQTFQATTSSSFFINVQFCLEMRTSSSTVGHNHEGTFTT